jgi:hypothetical protein
MVEQAQVANLKLRMDDMRGHEEHMRQVRGFAGAAGYGQHAVHICWAGLTAGCYLCHWALNSSLPCMQCEFAAFLLF